MMKTTLKKETMNRLMGLVAPLSGSEDAFVRMDLGVGKTPGANGMPDVMNCRMSVTNGTEQAEVGFLAPLPVELERPLEECNLLNPLESVVIRASEFVNVGTALSTYEQDITVEADGAKMVFDIEGIAQFPIYKQSEDSMKALVLHRYNSDKVLQHDSDVATFRFVASELITAVKGCMAVAKKANNETLKYYRFVTHDIPLVTLTVGEGDSKKTVPRYNTAVQIFTTNMSAFVSSGCNAYVHKGSGQDLTRRVAAAEGVESPIISFVEENGAPKPVVTPFKEYLASYNAERNIKAEGEFQFGIPCEVMETITKLAGVDAEDYVDVVVGKRYVQVMMRRIGLIFTAPQKSLVKASDFSYAARSLSEVFGRDGSFVEIDAKELSNALKVMGLYDKDALMGRYPLTLEVVKNGLSVVRGEAQTHLKVLKQGGEVECAVYGIDSSYIPCILALIPNGTIRMTYGLKKPVMVFTKGDVKPNAETSAIVVGGIDDVSKRIKEITDSYEEEERKKAEKAEKAKKAQ